MRACRWRGTAVVRRNRSAISCELQPEREHLQFSTNSFNSILFLTFLLDSTVQYRTTFGYHYIYFEYDYCMNQYTSEGGSVVVVVVVFRRRRLSVYVPLPLVLRAY
jgi:hypothetical protein